MRSDAKKKNTVTKKRKKNREPQADTDMIALPPIEWWTVVQVAAFMELSYHTARNQMLSGVFGKSRYDVESRTLRVNAAKVRAKAPEGTEV